MQKPNATFISDILKHFALNGTVNTVTPYGSGHINDTFLVTTDADREYVLQRLSPVAFREPEKVMENVSKVTTFLRGRIAARGGDPDRETLTLIPTESGSWHVMDSDGDCWRMYLNITGTVTHQLPENEAVFRQAGQAFGMFQTALKDYPADTLHETIPHFHDTPTRVQALRDAIARDAAHRAKDVEADTDFVLERAHRADALVHQLSEGALPLRVTHNDTKLNNVLMDAATDQALCVIDLDTVMPGLTAYDFGDAIRFGANTAAEDETDTSLIHFSLPMYKAWCEGYLAAAGDGLTTAELRSLPLGAWMMTYECGCRFLTDHLDGDRYFHIDHPGHNLERARNQFTLLADMERQYEDMQKIINEWTKE